MLLSHTLSGSGVICLQAVSVDWHGCTCAGIMDASVVHVCLVWVLSDMLTGTAGTCCLATCGCWDGLPPYQAGAHRPESTWEGYSNGHMPSDL